MLSTIVSKQTTGTRSPGCFKQKQNRGWSIWGFDWSEFSQFNENLIKIQDPHSQIENGETPEVEYPHEYAQKTQKHTKILQFFTPNCHKYYQMIKF